MIKQFEKHFHK